MIWKLSTGRYLIIILQKHKHRFPIRIFCLIQNTTRQFMKYYLQFVLLDLLFSVS